jgi:hypothetical protein
MSINDIKKMIAINRIRRQPFYGEWNEAPSIKHFFACDERKGALIDMVSEIKLYENNSNI